MIGTQIGRYRILEKIGEGPLGVVYKAVDIDLDRTVALRVFSPDLIQESEFLARLRGIIRALADLNHTNLATLYGFLVQDSIACMAMEYVDGETVQQMVLRRGPLPPEVAIPLFKQALLGIGYAHRAGLVHGDIHPGQLMLNRSGVVKVMDFGIGGMTRELGTKSYMSPEQVLRQAVDIRSDIYSLGATLYDMLTAHAPFEDDSDFQIMSDHVRKPPTQPTELNPGIPPYAEYAILKALEKNPDARFQSVEEFSSALEHVSGTAAAIPCSAPVVAPPMGAPPPMPCSAPPPAPRSRISIGGAILRGIEGVFAWFARPATPAERVKTTELPGGRVDRVHFSLTAPQFLRPASSSEIYVWAHLDQDRSAVIRRAREAIGQALTIKSKGPVALARGTTLSVLLHVDGLAVENSEETILWDGEIGNAIFLVTVPAGATGQRQGSALFYVGGLQIARMQFVLQIGTSSGTVTAVPGQEQRISKAFASYASADRDDVLARIQGIQKAAPSLEIFLDVLSLRSGQDWEHELWQRIPTNDVFYLFWSLNAKNSAWVEKEWRCALETRGLDFIDPVPLTPPELAPPPPELAAKHFNDWVLAFRRRRPEK